MGSWKIRIIGRHEKLIKIKAFISILDEAPVQTKQKISQKDDEHQSSMTSQKVFKKWIIGHRSTAMEKGEGFKSGTQIITLPELFFSGMTSRDFVSWGSILDDPMDPMDH